MRPIMSIEYIDDLASRLAQFVLTGDEREIIPEIQEFLQIAVDNLRDDDVIMVFSRIDHHLTFPDNRRFVFSYDCDPTGQSDEPFTFTLVIGEEGNPYTIVATGRR